MRTIALSILTVLLASVAQAALPDAATLVSPKGIISDTTPTYTWNAVTGATYYYLWVGRGSEPITKQWYTLDGANCSSTCSVTPGTLGGGDYDWWIQTWNPEGHGPWSEVLEFSISSSFVFVEGTDYAYVIYTLVPIAGNVGFCSSTPPEVALPQVAYMKKNTPHDPIHFRVVFKDGSRGSYMVFPSDIVMLFLFDESYCAGS